MTKPANPARSLRNSFKQMMSAGKSRISAALMKQLQDGSSGEDIKIVAKDGTDDGPAILYIMDQIGQSWFDDGITGKDVALFCERNRGREILVKMDCGGGSVFDGMTIMNSLADHDARVTAEITGLCYSAASYAILGCDYIRAHATSTFGIHPCHTGTYGNQYAHANSIMWMNVIDELIVDVYTDRTGMKRDEVFDLFKGADNDGTIMGATSAKEKGFIDEVIPLGTKRSDDDDDEEDDDDDEEDSGQRSAISGSTTTETPAEAVAEAQKRVDEANERAAKRQKDLARMNREKQIHENREALAKV